MSTPYDVTISKLIRSLVVLCEIYSDDIESVRAKVCSDQLGVISNPDEVYSVEWLFIVKCFRRIDD